MNSYQALMKTLEPETLKQMIRDADAESEAVNGICCEPGDCFVCEEDREPLAVVSIFDDIPMPRDPYGCANPVSQKDED